MMTVLKWGAVGLLSVFILLQLFEILTLKKKSGLEDFLADREEAPGAVERMGEQLLARFSVLKGIETHLAWAHLGERLLDVSLGGIAALTLGLVCLGWAAAALSPAPAARLLFLAGGLPYVYVRSVGRRVRKITERTLPETSALIAAELSAGSSVEDALLQAACLPGPLSRILNLAIDRAANVGRPLTARGSQPGMLREVLSELDLPALRGFAIQLDSVARSGVESGQRMQEISATLAAEYRQRIRDSIKTLDKRLTLAVSAFYFAPFFLILLMGTFGAALSSF
jgi:Flp pilus assembly protein TadB